VSQSVAAFFRDVLRKCATHGGERLIATSISKPRRNMVRRHGPSPPASSVDRNTGAAWRLNYWPEGCADERRM
jgi:hypothetical protein